MEGVYEPLHASTYGSPSTDDSDEGRLTRTSIIGDIEVITIIRDTSYMR